MSGSEPARRALTSSALRARQREERAGGSSGLVIQPTTARSKGRYRERRKKKTKKYILARIQALQPVSPPPTTLAHPVLHHPLTLSLLVHPPVLLYLPHPQAPSLRPSLSLRLSLSRRLRAYVRVYASTWSSRWLRRASR